MDIRRILLLFIIFLSSTNVFAQSSFRAIVKDSESFEALVGATAIIKGTSISGTSDASGNIILTDVPTGNQEIEFRFVGYENYTVTFAFPFQQDNPVEILLKAAEDELDEVVITSTRSTRTIQDIPTRVEFIAGEELEEKSNMKPGDIRMLLNESTGIQTQQTSATSANASIRIQGLDGRYTQILKDGFPLFSGAASGLGLLQTPPLDLKQVEVIKGSASTLYGGGAIAGLVNLISKTPTTEKDLRFHLNGTSGNGLDLNGFYAKRNDKIGTTIFASHNRNSAYDPADIGLSAIPKFSRFVFNPKLFIYFNEKTKVNFGVNASIEDRIGGDVEFIKGNNNGTNRFFEENNTERYSTQLSFDHQVSEQSSFHFKNSLSYFDRKISIPNYTFNGNQQATFSEVTYSNSRDKVEWIAGLNLWTDRFKEQSENTFTLRNYDQTTAGIFLQNTVKAAKWLNVETGLRADYVNDYGVALLPRISALFKLADNFSSRIGGGFGYKAPTIFTEETERIQYRNVLPVDKSFNKLERSYGGNIDFNYRTMLGQHITFSLNQLFFYTNLQNPLLLTLSKNGFQLVNSAGHIDTKGTESNIKLGYGDLKLFLGYTFTDARLHSSGRSLETPLTPKHRVNSVLMYEEEEKWKLGLEAYYFSKQKLSDGTTGRQYVICGFMAEKLWENFSLYLNFENFLDARQTRFDTVYSGSISNPVFRDIYAPLDGFVINGGIKFRL